MEINSFLAEWAIRFLENKDAVRKEIIKVERNWQGLDFCVQYKDRIKYFLVKPILDATIFEVLKKEESFGIIALNNPLNIKFLANKWKKSRGIQIFELLFFKPILKY